MHVLDDLDGFSERARALLARAARRVEQDAYRIPTETMRARSLSGESVLAPLELVIRREGFAQRYAGLRYRVRSSVPLPAGRLDAEADWEFDLGTRLCQEQRGWSFDWLGQRVSTPVWYLVHTDGRAGVSDGGPFVEVLPSMTRLIESHAVMDHVAPWDPYPGIGAFAPGLEALTDELAEVPEASGPMSRWFTSDTIAVRVSQRWTNEGPRGFGCRIWTRGDEGRRRVDAAVTPSPNREDA